MVMVFPTGTSAAGNVQKVARAKSKDGASSYDACPILKDRTLVWYCQEWSHPSGGQVKRPWIKSVQQARAVAPGSGTELQFRSQRVQSQWFSLPQSGKEE